MAWDIKDDDDEEEDPELIKWGLQLFESNNDNPNYYHYSSFNPLDGVVEFYNQHHSSPSSSSCSVNDNDLQHCLSNLLVSDNADLIPTSSSSGQEDGQDEGDIDDMRVSSSCSSPQEEDSSYHVEDWPLYSLEMMDENAFEVGNWLDEMVPIPHIPRINGEIPSIDEVVVDHQRLLDRLQVYDLVERRVQGDGNCQFRALSDQFYQTPEHHEFVRQQVVYQLKSYPGKYEGYVPMAYADYLEKMSKNGAWGDHVTLQAAADSYGVKIIVITSFKDTCYIEILPSVQRSIRVILLSFWAEVHYNSIFPRGDQEEEKGADDSRQASGVHG